MNINVIMPLYVIWIIISALIYHLKELYVSYASENIVRSRVYIVWKTVITVEFHIDVNKLSLPVEKMGHLSCVIKQNIWLTINAEKVYRYVSKININTTIWVVQRNVPVEIICHFIIWNINIFAEHIPNKNQVTNMLDYKAISQL
jgi:hypothetical protein